MKNYIFLGLVIVLIGCTGEDVSDPTPETTTSVSESYSLSVVETAVDPNRAPIVQLIDVPETLVKPKLEIVKGYTDFSSATYAELQGNAPFALFFTADDCERCRGMHTFFKNNLGVLPNHTQILKVTWDAFPNLQTELNVRRPATMAFFKADGSSETLLAPPMERVIDFFETALPPGER